MTSIHCLPLWLRRRLRKPEPQKITRLSKKDRQVLPTLNQSSTTFQNDRSSAGAALTYRHAAHNRKEAAPVGCN